MTANEIRLSNWFIGYDDKPFKWEIEHFANLATVYPDEIIKSPIPLTEEILLKAGGKRFDEDKIILMLNDPSTHLVLMKVGTHWFPQIEQTGEFASEGVNVVFLNFIDYLHQLQNLFFALTGEEIKIELE